MKDVRHRSFRKKDFFVLAALILVLTLITTKPVRSQELGYGGFGSINHGMAGATAALPLDGAGALYWNPATLGDLEHGELQLGFGRTNAPWYGDESLANVALFPVIAAGALVLLALEGDGDYEWWRSDSPHSSDNSAVDDFVSEAYSKLNQIQNYQRVRGMNLSFTLPVSNNRRWNFGMGIEETGSRKIRILTDPDDGEVVGVQLYRVKNLLLTPTVSYRIGPRFHVGLTPVLGITEFPGASMPELPGYERETDREHCGFGLQLGVYYKTKNRINIGFSVQSPQWTSAQTVRWIDGDGNVLSRRLRYFTEQPLRYVFGLAYTGFKRTQLTFDVRHYDFQHLSSFYGVTGRKAPKRATSLAAGLQYTPSLTRVGESFFVFRAGYQFSDCSAGWEDYYYNITAPIHRGHSIHYGVSIGNPRRDGLEVSFSLSHSFGGGRIVVPTVSGPRSFRRNPNDNAFWWSVRWKY